MASDFFNGFEPKYNLSSDRNVSCGSAQIDEALEKASQSESNGVKFLDYNCVEVDWDTITLGYATILMNTMLFNNGTSESKKYIKLAQKFQDSIFNYLKDFTDEC